MGSINLYLSRQANGQYMLSDKPPIRHEVDGTGQDDFYPEPGDRFFVRNFCKLLAAVALCKVDPTNGELEMVGEALKKAKLRRLESVPVRVTIEKI